MQNYIQEKFLTPVWITSSHNERLILGMDTENGKKIAFVQIAGLVAEKLSVMLI